MDQTSILLDSTTGELEILEFTVQDVQFAVNVSKVQEIVTGMQVTPTPNAQEGVRGMFNIRDDMYTVIDLKKILFGKETELNNMTYFILTNFNNLANAFMVDSVSAIRRCAWSSIIKPSTVLSSNKASITGVIHMDDSIISLIDFEAIVSYISPEMGLKEVTVEPPKTVVEKRAGHTILIADDSTLLNKMISQSLKKGGYTVISAEDGQETIEHYKAHPEAEMLVTDIEMPVMDGLESAKIIKGMDPDFPIVVFSSLVNDALERKVDSLHLEGMITKPEIEKVLDIVDEIVLRDE